MPEYKTITSFPCGTVDIPSSKSVAHRAVLCAAMADGESILRGISFSNDIGATLNGVSALGAEYSRKDGIYTINGGLNHGGRCELDCGESGSTLRFLTPVAAALGKSGCLTGQGRLMERPMFPYRDIGIIEEQDGAVIIKKMSGGSYRLPGNVSSQFITGILLALPLTDSGGELHISGELESASYVDLTIDVMQTFGITVERCGNAWFAVHAGQKYKPTDYTVEADYSQAAFFLVAGALGAPVECAGLRRESLQGDKAILDILKMCGANVEVNSGGTISVTADRLRPATIDVSNIPDLVPPLAVLLSFCEGESRIINAARLRLKESDRLSAIAHELNALGGCVEVGGDQLIIKGVKSLRGGDADSWGDHRIAMAAAIAAIRCEGEVRISGWQDVSKSYPAFWRDFEKGGKPE